MSRLQGSNVLRLRLLHCLCYPEFSLGNKASNLYAAAIMLLWWSKLTRIFTLKIEKASPPLTFLKIFLVFQRLLDCVSDLVFEPTLTRMLCCLDFWIKTVE